MNLNKICLSDFQAIDQGGCGWGIGRGWKRNRLQNGRGRVQIGLDRQPGVQTSSYTPIYYNLNRMASNKKMRSKALEAPCNVFELTPALSNLNSYYKQVKVEFLSSPELPKLSRTSHYPWPKFNNDGLFFTPAFVIPEDLALLTLVQDSLRKDYIQRIKANDEAETKDTLASLPIAEPEEQKRCGVCKVTYQSFQQHINQIGHKQNCINSKYTKHIYEFCNENYGSAEPKAQDSVPTLRIPHSPFIRKNSNPQMYKRPPVQKSVPACFSQPEQFEEHFLEDVNQIDIHNIDITPPVKRRRLN